MAGHNTERRITAILSVDVVGYSRLMGRDEAATLAALKAHRAELIEPKTAQYHGRTVKLMGDGALMEFASVVDAVIFAVEVQCAMVKRNAEVSEDRRIIFRMGINVGDIIVEGDDIHGDGVNIAARLESLAEPGGICIRRNVRNQVRDKLDLAFEDQGEIEVKNIARPMRVFRVVLDDKAEALVTPVVRATARAERRRWLLATAAALLLLVVSGVFWWQPWAPDRDRASLAKMAQSVPDKPSIAVLPFTNMSGDPDQEYFSDGITEDLITDLSKVSGLFVIARNSSFVYKGQNVSIPEIARALGVRYILEGSVRKAGGRVRINAQLIDSTTGGHVWAERFDRELADIFAIQDEVTQKIVAQLAIKLKPEEVKRLTREIAFDPEAYDLFLRGLERMQRFTPEYLAEARDLLSQSIMIDPRYARAFGVMAYTLVLEVSLSYDVDAEKNMQLAERYIHTALLLDDQVANVYFALSFVRQNQNRPEESIAAARKAVELDTNYANGYAQLASALIQAGRPEEAIEAVETAIRLSPSKPFFYVAVLGRAYFMLGRYRQAAEAYQQVVAKNPAFILGHLGLAASYGHLGMIDEAEWEAIEVLAIQPEFTLEQGRQLNNYQRPDDVKRYIEGLRLAGLPE